MDRHYQDNNWTKTECDDTLSGLIKFNETIRVKYPPAWVDAN